MSEYFVLPLTLLGIAAVLVACSRLFESLFDRSRRKCCSFCGKHHSEVAKLLEGPDCYICDKCVKVCSDVLMKECAEYRDSFRDAGKKAEPNAGPSGGSATPLGNSGAPEQTPSVT